MPYIDIIDDFHLDDYYKTDIHIKQEAYLKIMEQLSKKLGFDLKPFEYQKNSYPKFRGASFYKVPFQKSEPLEYLTNDIIKRATVKHLEYDINTVYSIKELESTDAYNVFLNGPSSLIVIENQDSSSDKELILFRDSFGSSLAPLLIPYYKKITLIDLRYINMNLVSNYVDFNEKDVLFFYSTLIVNNSHLLKMK